MRSQRDTQSWRCESLERNAAAMAMRVGVSKIASPLRPFCAAQSLLQTKFAQSAAVRMQELAETDSRQLVAKR